MQEIFMEPPLYFSEEHVWDLSFHPRCQFLACSLITGKIQLLRYSDQEVTPAQ
jgi:hypothetical protein